MLVKQPVDVATARRSKGAIEAVLAKSQGWRRALSVCMYTILKVTVPIRSLLHAYVSPLQVKDVKAHTESWIRRFERCVGHSTDSRYFLQRVKGRCLGTLKSRASHFDAHISDRQPLLSIVRLMHHSGPHVYCLLFGCQMLFSNEKHTPPSKKRWLFDCKVPPEKRRICQLITHCSPIRV